MPNTSPVDLSKISGTERASVLLLTLGEDTAAEVLKHMDPKEVQNVGSQMSETTNVTRDMVVAILDDFVTILQNQTNLGIGSSDYIKNMLVSALGEDKASGVIDRILLGGNSQGLETLKWMDPKSVAEIIRLEHPQIIAIVLSYLEPDQSAEVLSLLQDRVRSDVIMRIATLDGIPPSAIKELDSIMEKNFSASNNIKQASVGGKKTAADILNFIDSSMEGEIMQMVEETDENLRNEIAELMFVFADLVNVDDRSVQTMLREVSNDQLSLALKGSDPALKDKFLSNMSQRAAEMLEEDMEAKGPVKVSDVEAAQKEILATARRMEEEGKVMLSSGGGGEEMI